MDGLRNGKDGMELDEQARRAFGEDYAEKVADADERQEQVEHEVSGGGRWED